MHGQADTSSRRLGVRYPFHDAGSQEFTVNAECLANQPQLDRAGFVILRQQPVGRRERIAGPFQQVQQHRVRDRETRRQRFRSRFDQPFKGRLAPRNETRLRLLLHDLPQFLLVFPEFRLCLGHRLGVFDDMLGSLDDDGACGVVSRTARPAGNLVKLPGAEQAGADAVVLA